MFFIQRDDISQLQSNLGYFYAAEIQYIERLSSVEYNDYAFLENGDFGSADLSIIRVMGDNYLEASYRIMRVNSNFNLISKKMNYIGNQLIGISNKSKQISVVTLEDIMLVNNYITYIKEAIENNSDGEYWYKALNEVKTNKLIESADNLYLK